MQQSYTDIIFNSGDLAGADERPRGNDCRLQPLGARVWFPGSGSRDCSCSGSRAAWVLAGVASRHGRSSAGNIDQALRATRSIGVATGVLNTWAHDPAALASRWARWSDEWQRRLLVGLGVSHASRVDTSSSGPYRQPLAHMAGYLTALNGFGLGHDARILAALGPSML